MMYVAKVEIEFETPDNPIDGLHRVMRRTEWPGVNVDSDKTGYAEHYHIIELPKELK